MTKLSIVAWAGGALLTLVVVGGMVLFLFGETLFGSSRSTIDAYNRDALASAPVYPGAQLVQVRVHEARTSDGTLVRFREHLYATSARPDEVRQFYADNRPSAVRGVSVAIARPGFRWPEGPGVTSHASPATGEDITLFVLMAGQRYVEGAF
ncbi:MAG: hypothetical protein ACR2HN_07845 [Tepidiformaceae bacterium]